MVPKFPVMAGMNDLIDPNPCPDQTLAASDGFHRLLKGHAGSPEERKLCALDGCGEHGTTAALHMACRVMSHGVAVDALEGAREAFFRKDNELPSVALPHLPSEKVAE